MQGTSEWAESKRTMILRCTPSVNMTNHLLQLIEATSQAAPGYVLDHQVPPRSGSSSKTS